MERSAGVHSGGQPSIRLCGAGSRQRTDGRLRTRMATGGSDPSGTPKQRRVRRRSRCHHHPVRREGVARLRSRSARMGGGSCRRSASSIRSLGTSLLESPWTTTFFAPSRPAFCSRIPTSSFRRSSTSRDRGCAYLSGRCCSRHHPPGRRNAPIPAMPASAIPRSTQGTQANSWTTRQSGSNQLRGRSRDFHREGPGVDDPVRHRLRTAPQSRRGSPTHPSMPDAFTSRTRT